MLHTCCQRALCNIFAGLPAEFPFRQDQRDVRDGADQQDRRQHRPQTGQMPPKVVASGTCGAMPFTAETISPTGGEISPLSSAFPIITPTRSFRSSAAGQLPGPEARSAPGWQAWLPAAMAPVAWLHLARSSLYRCPQRHGVCRLPDVKGDTPKRQMFKRCPIGYFPIDVGEVRARSRPSKSNPPDAGTERLGGLAPGPSPGGPRPGSRL